MAGWDDLTVSAVDVEATALTAFSENRFDERFVDLEFRPRPEARKLFEHLIFPHNSSC